MKTDPVAKFESQIRGVPIEIESELQALISNSTITALDDKESSSAFDDTVGTDSTLGEQVNNDFRQPINCTVIEEDGVLYIQNCLLGEYYYESCEI